MATGATHNYFGNDHWHELAPGLKRIEDATELRRRILLAFERAEMEENPDEREALMSFVIVGGGPTGVEMAGRSAGNSGTRKLSESVNKASRNPQ